MLFVQVINLRLCGWPLISLLGLLVLRRRRLTGVAQAVWAMIVVAVPYLGALAFFILQPGEQLN